MEDISIKGQWWLPEKPRKKYFGVLTYNHKSGGELSLEDTLGIDNFQIILGKSYDNKKITLHSGFNVSRKYHPSGKLTDRYVINNIFINKHFKVAGEISFDQLYFHVTYLDDWTENSCISVNYDRANRDCSIHASIVDPIKLYEDKNIKIELVTTSKYPSRVRIQKFASVSQKTYFKCSFLNKKANLEDSIFIVKCLQDFINIATVEPVFIDDLRGFSGKSKTSDSRISILTMSLLYKDISKTLDWPYMTFTRGDIDNKIEEYLGNWLTVYRSIEPVCFIYFDAIRSGRARSDIYFMTYIQSLEAHHRRVHNRTEMSKLDHKRRMGQILYKVPKRYHKWLKDKLAFSNEYTLKKRLLHIYEMHEPSLTKLHLDKQIFCRLAVNTRNYYTHYTKGTKKKILSGIKIYEYAEIFKFMMLLQLLSDIGFSSEAASNCVKNHYIYRQSYGSIETPNSYEATPCQ